MDYLAKSSFLIPGNICGKRVRLGRALQDPPITQKELASKIHFMGYDDMTTLIISRIEKNQRHVCDIELLLLSKALNVSMEWLCGSGNDLLEKKN